MQAHLTVKENPTKAHEYIPMLQESYMLIIHMLSISEAFYTLLSSTCLHAKTTLCIKYEFR